MTISEYYQPCYQSQKCNREEETKTLLKLIVARESISYEGRISLKDMQDEYYFLSNGKEIPFEELGYYSLNHLLRKIPEIIPDNENDHSEIMYKINHWCPEQLIEDLEEKLKLLGNDWDRYNKRGSYKYSSKRSKRSKRSSSSFCSTSDYQSCPTSSNWSSEDDTCSSLTETSLKPLIFTDNQEDKKRKVYEPTIEDQQLIGDDYFLQLAFKYSENPIGYRQDKSSPISWGTVKSGLSIRKASERLKKISSMSNKLTICLGSVDVYQGRNADKMINDMINFLEQLEYNYSYNRSAITLCTIPPLPNVSIIADRDRYSNLHSYNNWLRDYAMENGYELIDFSDEFVEEENYSINFELYQCQPRKVSGCQFGYVLWNYYGRQKAMKRILRLDTTPYGSEASIY